MPMGVSSGPDTKNTMRKQARKRRKELHAAAGDAGNLIRDLFCARFVEGLAKRDLLSVAGYWPTGAEISDLPLLSQLVVGGWPLGLPVIVANDEPLAFAPWHPDGKLTEGAHGIMEPVLGEPHLKFAPDIILVPLLAFDAAGHRLGQGGGYYDRTLAFWRSKADILAIGLAYDGQQVDVLPHDKHDQMLDMVITESRIVEYARTVKDERGAE